MERLATTAAGLLMMMTAAHAVEIRTGDLTCADWVRYNLTHGDDDEGLKVMTDNILGYVEGYVDAYLKDDAPLPSIVSQMVATICPKQPQAKIKGVAMLIIYRLQSMGLAGK